MMKAIIARIDDDRRMVEAVEPKAVSAKGLHHLCLSYYF